jgi:carbon monoxide dehydrogenase subunit G
MKVEGERLLDAPREIVWGVVNSPAEMAELMPGVQSFEVKDDTHWSAKVKIPLGLGSLAMAIDFEKTEERELEFASLHAKGHGVGAMLNMQTSFTLEPADAGTTRMLWAADVSIAGPVGSMGQRVLQPIVKQQVNLVLNALDKRVGVARSAEATSATDDAAPAASQP